MAGQKQEREEEIKCTWGRKMGQKGERRGEGEWEKSKSNRTLYIPVSILRQKICKHKAGNKRTNEKKDQV